ncbi:hypothetical protein FEM33_01570 [Dyadobacter flavalbus]|uniref:Uncharacterized protein n=1 Tax=Dyadobacter flavalbus TaxID=2579942 RepID=A0A5M8QZ18_9BACT|nr:hypothetical protein [Dyadobacter flavalbus]KAA6441449.1 hypothetical protein FEM33_01570 [Dyadobacter flavalbus]
MADPVGFQKQQLYGRNNPVRTLRVPSYADMVADSLRSSATPKIYVVDIDETNGGAEDVPFWFDGIEIKPFGSSNVAAPGSVALSSVNGLDPILRMLGMGAGVTLATARTFTSTDPTVFMINNIAGDNLAIYDSSDINSADNGTTVIVGSGGRRYKVLNVVKALQLITKATDIFQ